MLQKLPKFLKVAQKTASCPKVAEQLVDSANVHPGGGYFTINSYGGVRRKDFCYDPIPEFLADIDTQSQNLKK